MKTQVLLTLIDRCMGAGPRGGEEAQMVVAALELFAGVKPQQEVRTKWRLSGTSLMEAE